MQQKKCIPENILTIQFQFVLDSSYGYLDFYFCRMPKHEAAVEPIQLERNGYESSGICSIGDNCGAAALQ